MQIKYTLMATLLSRSIERAQVTTAELSRKLGYRTAGFAQFWLDGRSLPPLSLLPRLAEVLGVDVRTLSIGWQIESAPALDAPLRTLLAAAGLSFPMASDPDVVELVVGHAWAQEPPP
jgi:transcriptional regulator with XRE-family HTH domain